MVSQKVLCDLQNALPVKFRKYDSISICQHDVKNCEVSFLPISQNIGFEENIQQTVLAGTFN